MKKLFILCAAVIAVIVMTAGCVQTDTPVVYDPQDLNGTWKITSEEIYSNEKTPEMHSAVAPETMKITQDGRSLIIDSEIETLKPVAAMCYGKDKDMFLGKTGDVLVFGKVINGNQILVSFLGTDNRAVSSILERGESAPVEFPNVIRTEKTELSRGISVDGTARNLEGDFELAILEQKGGIVSGTIKKDDNSSEFYGVIYDWNDEETSVFAYVPELNFWVSLKITDDNLISKIFTPNQVLINIYGDRITSADEVKPEFMQMVGKWKPTSVNAVYSDGTGPMFGDKIIEGIGGPTFVISNQNRSLFSGTGNFVFTEAESIGADILGEVSPDNKLTMFVFKENGTLEIIRGALVDGTFRITSVEDGIARSFVLEPVKE